MRALAATRALTDRHRRELDEIDSLVRSHSRAVRALAFEDMPGTFDSLEAQNANS
jgi:hypothetical protein